MLCALRGTIGRKAPKSAAFRRVLICRSTLKQKIPRHPSKGAAAGFPRQTHPLVTRRGRRTAFRRSSDLCLSKKGCGFLRSSQPSRKNPVTGFHPKRTSWHLQRRYRSGITPDYLVQQSRLYAHSATEAYLVVESIVARKKGIVNAVKSGMWVICKLLVKCRMHNGGRSMTAPTYIILRGCPQKHLF